MGAHEKDFPFVLGSMPPNSHSILDEGAVFMSYKLVDGGIFQEEGNFRICGVVVSSVIPSSERCFSLATPTQNCSSQSLGFAISLPQTINLVVSTTIVVYSAFQLSVESNPCLLWFCNTL